MAKSRGATGMIRWLMLLLIGFSVLSCGTILWIWWLIKSLPEWPRWKSSDVEI